MRNSIRLVILLMVAVTGFAAESVYMVCAQLPGEVIQKGREKFSEVLAFNHEIVSPRDSASGLATGKRQHMPFRCVIPHGSNTPLLFKALSNNEIIPKVEIQFWRPTTIGGEVLYMKYELENVSVSSVRPWMPNVKEAAVANFGSQVEVSFVYQKITWTFTNGGVTHTDSWNQIQ
jgi:type VI secretion system secreted protein Hcp